MRRLCESFLIASAAAGMAHAAPPLISEDTGTQGKGVAQLEFTVEAPREDRGGTSYDGVEAALVLNYGLAENADLQFVLPYLRVTEHTAGVRTETEGRLDARINVKWRFLEQDTFSLALMPGIIIPTGKEGLSTERVNPGVMLIGSYEPQPFTVNADVGYRYLNNVLGLREHLYHASASLHYAFHESLKLVADYSWENTLDPGPTGSVRYSTLGAIWVFAPGVGIGCGVKMGHGEFAIDRTYLCGMGLRLN
jgi:Putative MetA-pathway of phenol degradation